MSEYTSFDRSDSVSASQFNTDLTARGRSDSVGNMDGVLVQKSSTSVASNQNIPSYRKRGPLYGKLVTVQEHTLGGSIYRTKINRETPIDWGYIRSAFRGKLNSIAEGIKDAFCSVSTYLGLGSASHTDNVADDHQHDPINQTDIQREILLSRAETIRGKEHLQYIREGLGRIDGRNDGHLDQRET